MKEKKTKHVSAAGKSGSSRRGSGESEDFLTYSPQGEHPAGGPKGREFLGERVRNAREMRGLTLLDLSSRTGIGLDTLKRVESNEVIPPLGELIKLGKALEMKMGYFISPGADKPMTIVRSDQRQPISRYGERRSEQYGYSYESLAPEKANRLMEPFIVTLLPTDVEETSTHDGQEFLFVLEGQMMARVGSQTEFLGPGDALYYDSSQPHFVRCVGGSETRILAVLYTGSE
ncbi:MAG: XRE family transcriptional regulator [Dehalococcoidia bacterium]